MTRKREIRAALAGVLVTAAAAMAPACGGQPVDPVGTAGTPEQAIARVQTRRACAPARGKLACEAHVVVDAVGAVKPFSTPSGFGPPDLQSAYALTGIAAPAVTPTIAIAVAYDDSHAESDLAVYRAQYGLPACSNANGCLSKVNQEGAAAPLPAAPPSADDWTLEDSLDLDLASAICPSCKLLLVEADDDVGTGLSVSVNTAATLGASVIVAPWGGTETSSDPATNAAYFVHPGIAIFAAAGDNGNLVEFPASSPNVVAVGGTTLEKSNTLPRGWTEAAWSQGGSGCSQYELKPSWQTDTGCPFRTTVDVAAVADPNTALAIYDSTSGGWSEVGGTDAAATIVASIYALTGHASATPALAYANASAFYDVTSGNTGTCTPAYLCTAGAGYDGPTGIGTPNGAALAETGLGGSGVEDAGIDTGVEAGIDSGASSCSHTDCTSGTQLATGCDPCVTKICTTDPYCCTTAWDSTCISEVSSVCGESTCGGAPVCGHADCAVGTKLATTCDPCVAKICGTDSYCCITAWDNICVGEVSSICNETTCSGTTACAHSDCTAGVKLATGCNTCVKDICASDSYCCNTKWDSVCISEVSSICGETCN
jgi:hypothetical protein